MKKLLAIILSSLLLFTSCGKTSDHGSVSDHPSDALTEGNDNTSSDPFESENQNSTDAEQSEVSEDGLYIGGEFISDSEKEQIKARNFPAFEEVQEKYPDKTVITWLLSNVTFMDAYTPFRTAEINEYLDSLGCDFAVCFIPYSGSMSYMEMLNGYIESGTQIDILSPSYSSYADPEENNYQRDALQGLLEPLDQYFEDTGAGKAYYESMPEKYFDAFRVNGKIYGINGNMNNLFGSIGYSVDKNLAEKYGWDFSKSISEQIPLLEEAARLEKNMCAVYCSGYGNVGFYPDRFDQWVGVFWSKENGEICRITECREYRERLELLYTLNEKGLLKYHTPIMDDACFVLVEGMSYYGETGGLYNKAIGNNPPSERIAVPYSTPKIANILTATGISARSEHKDKAFELLILTQTDPYLNNLLVFGLEGEDYSFDGKRAQEGENAIMNFFRFGNLAICHPFENYSDTINQDYTAVYEAAETVPYLGFAFNVEPVSKEYLAVKEIMRNYGFIYGESAEQSLAKLDDMLDQAGIDKVLEEMNRQYNEWKGSVR